MTEKLLNGTLNLNTTNQPSTVGHLSHMHAYHEIMSWTASSEFGTYSLCEQRRFRRACASAQSRQNLRYSLIQAVNQEEPSDRKPDPWPLWMTGHAQLKFVMTECSKTQIRLTGPSFRNVLQLAVESFMHGRVARGTWRQDNAHVTLTCPLGHENLCWTGLWY